MAEIHLKTPISEEEVRKLKIGDIVYLTGDGYSSWGTPVYKITEAIKAGEKLPFELEGRILSLGFTTSARYQDHIPEFVKNARVRVIYAKGGMNKDCLDAFQEYGCVYGTIVGGTGWLYPATKSEPTGWPEGVERGVMRTILKDYGPCFITMDANGNSIAHDIEEKKKQKMPEILKRLNAWPVTEPYHISMKNALGV
jgi:fumarate hydratase subunit beta